MENRADSNGGSGLVEEAIEIVVGKTEDWFPSFWVADSNLTSSVLNCPMKWKDRQPCLSNVYLSLALQSLHIDINIASLSKEPHVHTNEHNEKERVSLKLATS